MTKADEKRLRVFHLKCLQRILCIFYPNLVRNEVILQRTGDKDIMDKVRKRKWCWIGHVVRRGDNHLAKEVINFKMEEGGELEDLERLG